MCLINYFYNFITILVRFVKRKKVNLFFKFYNIIITPNNKTKPNT